MVAGSAINRSVSVFNPIASVSAQIEKCTVTCAWAWVPLRKDDTSNRPPDIGLLCAQNKGLPATACSSSADRL